MAKQHSDPCPAGQCNHRLARHDFSDCTFCGLANSWVWCNDCGVYCRDCTCDHANHPDNLSTDEDEEEDAVILQQVIIKARRKAAPVCKSKKCRCGEESDSSSS